MRRRDSFSGRFAVVLLAAVTVCPLARAQAPTVASPSPQQPTPSPDATVEGLFADFMHYARMGRFTAADAYATALLSHPETTPVRVMNAANKDPDSVATLQILIANSTIGANARKVQELIEQGEYEMRKDPQRIQDNIRKLGGDPQQEYFAIRHLAESGEYAIPWMIQTLLDPNQQALWPRVINALPRIGKGAVGPLVEALEMSNDDMRLHVIRALGEIGYPQAVPYLARLVVAADMPESTKSAALAAIGRIAEISGRPQSGTADEQFFQLAEKYYDEDASVRADPRLPEANVWYWDGAQQILTPTVVPTRIFGQVMAMRCCEEALRITPDRQEAMALWLAGNIRRESRLGLDTESGDPAVAGETDATRPQIFPRALYFTQTAGPRYAHLVLQRAVEDGDAAVALGAIAALRTTAGQASLVGTEDYKQPLVQALRFPDPLVRIRAALALAAALPKSQFADSEFVMPVLAQALSQTGRREVLVVDPDEANRNRVMDALRTPETVALGAAGLYEGLQRARTEFQATGLIVVASDVPDGELPALMQELRGEFVFAHTPVIILVKPDQALTAEQAAAGDIYTERADATADGDALRDHLADIESRTGRHVIDPDLALAIALETADVLRAIAADGRTVYNWGVTEPALIGALSSPSEDLQTRAAAVLALTPTETGQRAVAHMALTAAHAETLRVASFGFLAESTRNFGNMLEAGQVTQLVEIAKEEPNLVLRTAASQALGAANLATNQASEIIRSYYGG